MRILSSPRSFLSPRAAASTLVVLLLCISSPGNKVQAQSTCTGSNVFFTDASQGSCLSWWSNGNDYKYPGDFGNILNEVEIYSCPTSGKRVIIANGIPDHDVTLANPNVPCAFNRVFVMPLNPSVSSSKYDIPVRGMIAVATNGVPTFGPQEVDGENALDPTGTVKDAGFWYGHPSIQKAWHFHSPHMGEETIASDKLLGYALDGFPIYGPLDSSAPFEGLDECNGRYVDGSYRYHVVEYTNIDANSDYCVSEGSKPEINWRYIVGCYSGNPDNTSIEDSTSYDLPNDCVKEDGSPTAAPTPAPTPTSPSAPTAAPTNAPTSPSAPTANPTNAPTKAPTDCSETGSDKFLWKVKKNGQAATRTCTFLSNKTNKVNLCKKKVAYSGNYKPPQIVCQVTCDSCSECYENKKTKFFRMKKKNGKSVYKTCNWLSKKKDTLITNLCTRNKTDGLYPGAADACPQVCSVGSC